MPASRAKSAFSKILCLKTFSLSGGRLGSPDGAVKSPPNTILLAPTLNAMEVKAVTTALGIPALSSSFEIVAPQRVQVPQVVVIIAAETPASFKAFAMEAPMEILLSILVPIPQVEKNSWYTSLIAPSFLSSSIWS